MMSHESWLEFHDGLITILRAIHDVDAKQPSLAIDKLNHAIKKLHSVRDREGVLEEVLR